jgi:mono/diheme cytochrome c family protein
LDAKVVFDLHTCYLVDKFYTLVIGRTQMAAHRLRNFEYLKIAGLMSVSALALAVACLGTQLRPANAADQDQIARGKYMVSLMGCGDCHTPGHFFGKDDLARNLAGSDVGFGIPLGVFVGPNLTPDNETGLGNWTPEQIAAALTKGERPDGRILAPVMPWRRFANLTPSDAQAIALYLKSLPPISHQVPGPFGPNQVPTVFVMSPQPPDNYYQRTHAAPAASAAPK